MNSAVYIISHLYESSCTYICSHLHEFGYIYTICFLIYMNSALCIQYAHMYIAIMHIICSYVTAMCI